MHFNMVGSFFCVDRRTMYTVPGHMKSCHSWRYGSLRQQSLHRTEYMNEDVRKSEILNQAGHNISYISLYAILSSQLDFEIGRAVTISMTLPHSTLTVTVSVEINQDAPARANRRHACRPFRSADTRELPKNRCCWWRPRALRLLIRSHFPYQPKLYTLLFTGETSISPNHRGYPTTKCIDRGEG